MNASNNTIKSFALGYNATNAIIDGVTYSTNAVVATATETKQVSTSFFAGIKFAINERRGVKPVVPTTKDDAAKREEAERKLREAQDLYARAHAPSSDAGLIIVAKR